MKRFLLTVLFFIFIYLIPLFLPGRCMAYEQLPKADSLLKILPSTKDNATKVKLLTQLFYEYEYNDLAKAKKYINMALDLSEKTDDSDGIIRARACIAFLAGIEGDYAFAQSEYEKALKLAVLTNNQTAVARLFSALGQLAFEKTDYTGSLAYHFKALKIAEETKDENAMPGLYYNIALVYDILNKLDKALEYNLKALKIDEKFGDRASISFDLSAVATVYGRQKKFTEALKYALKALQINTQINNKVNLAANYLLLANLYSEMLDISEYGDLDQSQFFNEAKNYYFKANEIHTQLGDKKNLSAGFNNLGKLYLASKNYTLAENYLKRSLNIDTANNFIYQTQYDFLYLSELYETSNRHIEALKYYKKYQATRDTVFNEIKIKQIEELQAKYEVEKKEKELATLKSEAEVARYKKYLLSGMVIFLILASSLIISRQRLKSKKQHELDKIAKRLIQADLEQKQHEVKELKYTLKINEEKLNHFTLLIKEKTRLLDDMEEKIKIANESPTAEQLLNTIKEAIDPSVYWEEFIVNFNLVYKSFFDQLTTKFPDLTRNELNFCALLKCNLGNKEIANVLKITPDSAKRARTRLKKKLSLNEEDNLSKFIGAIN